MIQCFDKYYCSTSILIDISKCNQNMSFVSFNSIILILFSKFFTQYNNQIWKKDQFLYEAKNIGILS